MGESRDPTWPSRKGLSMADQRVRPGLIHHIDEDLMLNKAPAPRLRLAEAANHIRGASETLRSSIMLLQRDLLGIMDVPTPDLNKTVTARDQGAEPAIFDVLEDSLELLIAAQNITERLVKEVSRG